MSVQSGNEEQVEELTITPLPPLPKLRLKPGLLSHPKFEKKELIKNEEKKKKNEFTEQNEEEEKTSRLLMKSECRSSGGRRKNGSSLVHSIPKFSEVKKGKLSEVQKVLQSRLLTKQRLKQQQQLLAQQQQPPALSSKSALSETPNLLQNLIYNQKSKCTISKNSSCSSPPIKVRRCRKLDKREITHVLKVNASNLPVPILPHLSEVTITPKVIYTPKPSRHAQPVEEALDLRAPGRVSPLPLVQSCEYNPLRLSYQGQEEGKRKLSGNKTTSGSLSDFNPETAIRKFKFTPGEYPCLEEQKPPIRYILDPEKKTNHFMSGDFSTSLLNPRANTKIGPSSYHQDGK